MWDVLQRRGAGRDDVIDTARSCHVREPVFSSRHVLNTTGKLMGIANKFVLPTRNTRSAFNVNFMLPVTRNTYG